MEPATIPGVDVAAVGRPVGDVGSAEEYLARIRALEARDDPQQRRLAGSGRPEQREELPRPDSQIDSGHGSDPWVLLAHADKPYRSGRQWPVWPSLGR